MKTSISSPDCRRISRWCPAWTAAFHGLLLAMFCLAAPALVQAQTAWVQSRKAGSEMRFLFTSRIERYDLNTKAWLTPITLPRTGATAFTGDGTSAFVAYGTSIRRYTADFTGETTLGTASSSVNAVFLDGNLLIAVHPSTNPSQARLTCYDRSSGQQLSTVSASGTLLGASFAPSLNKVIGRRTGYSPDNFVMATYSDAGILSPITTTSAGYPSAAATFISPDESRVLDSRGSVFNTTDLSPVTNIPYQITSMAWNENGPYVLSGETLLAYSPVDMLETARLKMPTPGAELAVSSTEAFVFRAGNPQPFASILPLSDLRAPGAGPPLDPVGLAFGIDDSFMTRDGVLCLFSREKRSVFRWSTVSRAWLPGIPLEGEASKAAYVSGHDAIYTSYRSRFVRKIDLTSASPLEVPFIAMSAEPEGLAGAGNYLYTSQQSPASITLFNSSGVAAALPLRGYVGNDNTWDPVRSRIYHYREGFVPSALVYHEVGANGVVTSGTPWNYHDAYPSLLPIRVSQDGTRVLIGSGHLFKADGLVWDASLGTTIKDAAWQNNTLYTIREVTGSTEIQSWTGPKFNQIAGSAKINGTPVNIFPLTAGTVVTTMVNGAPRFALFEDLTLTSLSPAAPLAADSLTVETRTTISVGLRWVDISDNEDGFRIEYRPATGPPAWLAGPVLPRNAQSGIVSGLTAGTAYEFRVISSNGALETASPSLASTTLSTENQPIGEPYDLSIVQIFNNRITLAWQDNANNETGFILMRSTTAGSSPTRLTIPANTAVWTDTGLTANTLYYYRIQAVNGTVEGDLSTQINARTLQTATAPPAPTNFTASGVTFTTANLAWTDNSANEDQFIIEASTNPVTTWTEVTRTSYNVTNFQLTNLVPNRTYNLRIRAINSIGTSTAATVSLKTPVLGGTYYNTAMRSGDVYYFVFYEPNRIERYDLSKRTWLEPWASEAPVSALWVDNSAVFVAEGSDLYRWSLDGLTKTKLLTAASPISLMATVGDALVYQRSGNPDYKLNLVSKTTAAARPLITFTDNASGITADPVESRVYLRTNSQIYTLDIAANGSSGIIYGSIFDNNAGAARQPFPYPSGSRIASGSGVVYSNGRLEPVASLGSSLLDLAFHGVDVPIVIRGNKVTAYSNTFVETGTWTLDTTVGKRLAVAGGDLIVFVADGANEHGMNLRIIPLGELGVAEPDAPVSPDGLAYTADQTLVDKNGVIYIYSKALQKIFPWSATQRKYLPAVPLQGSPVSISYSDTSHTIFTGYGHGVLRKIDLTAATPVEAPYASYVTWLKGIESAGQYLYTTGLETHRVFGPTGNTVSSGTRRTGTYNTWDPVQRRIYHFITGVSPQDFAYDTLSTGGTVTGPVESPYHGGFTVREPIRVSAEGNFIIIGGGEIFKASDLTKAKSLGYEIADALWKDTTVYTLRLVNGSTQLQSRTGPLFDLNAVTRQIAGTPLRVYQSPEGLVVATNLNGAPQFTILNEALEPVYTPPLKPAAPGTLTQTGRTTNSVTLQWSDLSNNETGFAMEYRPVGPSSSWFAGGTANAGDTSGTVFPLLPGTAYEFRVFAVNGTLKSDYSASVTATTISSAEIPQGEPYNLAAARVFHNSVTLSWSDNAGNETGFRIIRTPAGGGPETVFTVPANTTLYTNSGLTAGTGYQYSVQAVNGSVVAPASAPLTVTTLSAAGLPRWPHSLQTTGITTTSLTLTWTDDSTNEEQFIIQWQLNGSSTWVEAGRVAWNVTTFNVTGLTPKSTYLLRVASANASGSMPSQATAATTKTPGGEYTGHTARQGDIYYFTFADPDRIERYNLASRAWLTPLPATARLGALWTDESGVYAARESVIVRWPLDGSGSPQTIHTANGAVGSLFTMGDLLGYKMQTAHKITVINKSSGAVLAEPQITVLPLQSVAVDAAARRVYLLTNQLSAFEMGSDGTMSRFIPPSGGFNQTEPGMARCILFPGGARVADDTGNIFGAEGLRLSTSVGSFVDMDFHGSDVPVILRNNRLEALTNTLQTAGTVTLSGSGFVRVAVSGGDALAFARDETNDHGLRVQVVPLQSLKAPEPGRAIIAEVLPYQVDDAFLDRDGQLRIYSNDRNLLLTWSPESRTYTGSVTLPGPLSLSYSTTQHTLFAAYQSRRIRRMSLSAAAPQEADYAEASSFPKVIGAADDFLYLGRQGGRASYGPTGVRISNPEEFSFGTGSFTAWDAATRRLFTSGPASSSSDLLRYTVIGPDGSLGPIQSAQENATEKEWGAIRLNEDATRIVLAGGPVYDGTTLRRLTILPERPVDAAWRGKRLLTLEAMGTSHSAVWSRDEATFERRSFTGLVGKPVRIFARPGTGFLVMTHPADGLPRIHLLDENLKVIHESGPATAPVIAVPPESLRVPFGREITLNINAAGSAPLRYEWFLNDAVLPEADSNQYFIPRMGSKSAGMYHVRISNSAGTVTSQTFSLNAGPVKNPLVAPGNLLAVSAKTLYEYTTAGVLVKSVPLPVENTGVDVIVDAAGVIHVLNFGNQGKRVLYSYDGDTAHWKVRPLNILQNSSDDSILGLAGEWLRSRAGFTNTVTGEFRLPPEGFSPLDFGSGPDFRLVGVSIGQVREFDPMTWSWSGVLRTLDEIGFYGFGVGTESRLYGGDSSLRLAGFDNMGRAFAKIPLGQRVQDVSVSATGLLAAGVGNNMVLLSDSALTGSTFLTLPGTITDSRGVFTAWSPVIPQPVPAFTENNAPSDPVEDLPWSWTPKTSHPDPDAELTVSADSLPPWLSYHNGVFSGTPLHGQTGSVPLRLRVTGPDQTALEQTFVLNVIEVNDRPVGRNASFTRLEDAAPELLDPAVLFSDEETPVAQLQLEVLSNTGGVVTTVPDVASGGKQLRLGFVPDAFGTAVLTLRATDEGGLSAEAILTIQVTPVNDAPVLPAIFPEIHAGSAAADARIDFAAVLRDPDPGDTHVWNLVSNSNPALFSRLDFDSAGGLLIAYAPFLSGRAVLVVEVRDADGAAALTTVEVIVPPIAPPAIVAQSALTLNRQTGLFEQTVTLRNEAARSIGGFELFVTGLPAGATLHNNSGTRDNGYVAGDYRPLESGATRTLVLEYYSPGRDSLQPVLSTATALPSTDPAIAHGSPGAIAIDRVTMLQPGALLIEFPTLPGALYQVQYSADGKAWTGSPLRIRAGGNRLQWIDRGPPGTISPPMSGTTRFYRVRQLPGS